MIFPCEARLSVGYGYRTPGGFQHKRGLTGSTNGSIGFNGSVGRSFPVGPVTIGLSGGVSGSRNDTGPGDFGGSGKISVTASGGAFAFSASHTTSDFTGLEVRAGKTFGGSQVFGFAEAQARFPITEPCR